MLVVETIAKIRRGVLSLGKPIKEICRELHLSRKVVRKVIRSNATEFHYERSRQPLPRIGPWRQRLESLLEENESKAARERLTLVRLYEELRGLGFEGSYAAVRRYAIAWREKRASATASAYVPLTFAPGEAYQFDWSHEIVVMDGVTTTVKVAHVRLCHNQKLLLENAYMKRNCARKSARGGRALLTGLMRCGRCGRMMRVFYGMGKSHAHRYQCRGDDGHVGAGLCIGAGGVRVDRAVALQLLEAVSDRAVEAAIFATDQIERSTNGIIAAAERDLEAARYEAGLAARRHELVDPAKRFVARELEARWNGALEKVVAIERRIEELRAFAAARPRIDRAVLMRLAQDLPTAWNAPTTGTRTKQRIADRLAEFALLADEAELLAQPRLEIGDERSSSGLANVAPFLRTTTANVLLDRIESGDAVERLAGDWRCAAVGDLIEPPSHMRPAEREAHVALFGEDAVAGVAVDLENALEAGEMRDRLRRFAVGRIDIGDRRRVRSAPGPVVSRTGPKLAGLDAPAARIEHRRRRLVGSSTTAESK